MKSKTSHFSRASGVLVTPCLLLVTIAILSSAAQSCGGTHAEPFGAEKARDVVQADRPGPGSPAAAKHSAAEDIKVADEACRPLKQEVVLRLHTWLLRMAQVPVGGVVNEKEVGNPMYVTDDFSLKPSDPFVNLGFEPVAGREGFWQRHTSIDSAAGVLHTRSDALILSDMPELPAVDCIAISSIGRSKTNKVYLFDTIRSIFEQFPVGAEINVLVGNADDDYVRPDRIVDEFGKDNARRIHIWRTPEEVSSALAELPIAKRGGWNFARGLLNYEGNRGIIILEDDVEWAPGSPALLERALKQTDLPIVSIYNRWCEELAGRRAVAEASGLAIETPHRAWGFQWFSQGFYIRAAAARAVGEHYLVHLNPYCWDKLLNYFLIAHDLDVGYTYPSALQHRGVVSSGPWGEHETACWLGDRH